MAVMRCTVALPDRALFQGEVSYASIPGTDGYFGVLPGHELAVSLNREGGVVTLTVGENEKREFLVMGGATSVLDDKVTVLARFGTAVEDIDAEAVRAEADECKSAIAELEQKNDPQDQATLMTHQKKLEWCEAQLAHVGQAA
ncbi:ATP synthase F1 subunit epsilon [Adlercreutzia equolifaciens]|uniref:ATP synthase F1 subunit epsilon n=1 Tax=Adlercreutzia equolifaciens TaxID=446660 RepID=UPI003AF0E349